MSPPDHGPERLLCWASVADDPDEGRIIYNPIWLPEGRTPWPPGKMDATWVRLEWMDTPAAKEVA